MRGCAFHREPRRRIVNHEPADDILRIFSSAFDQQAPLNTP